MTNSSEYVVKVATLARKVEEASATISRCPNPLDEARAIPGFQGYHASIDGIIYCSGGRFGSEERPYKVKQFIHGSGRRRVNVRVGGKKTIRDVSRLVAFAWLGMPDDGQEIRHKDGILSNCHASNLAWHTRGESGDVLIEVIRRLKDTQNQNLKDDCIVWDQRNDRDGYGVVWKDGKAVLAHRLAYCESYGISLNEIDGAVIRHKCDNPPCINPTHLEPGAPADNVRDRVARGRSRYLSGESNPHAKLTNAKVAEIRKRRAEARVTLSVLAKEYAVSEGHISDILNGKAWKCQEPEVKA